MKQLCAVALVILIFAMGASGQRKVSDEPTLNILINLEKQSWEAWKKRDGKFFQNFLADDHVEVGVGGLANKAQIVAFVGSPVCVVESYSIDKFRLTMFDARTALLTYHAEQNTACGGKPIPSPVWVSSLYVKRGKHWTNALYQQTATVK